LMKIGILFNGAVATRLAVPITRFFSPRSPRARNGYLAWVPLGPSARSRR
jgi:hypothetical protein